MSYSGVENEISNLLDEFYETIKQRNACTPTRYRQTIEFATQRLLELKTRLAARKASLWPFNKQNELAGISAEINKVSSEIEFMNRYTQTESAAFEKSSRRLVGLEEMLKIRFRDVFSNSNNRYEQHCSKILGKAHSCWDSFLKDAQMPAHRSTQRSYVDFYRNSSSYTPQGALDFIRRNKQSFINHFWNEQAFVSGFFSSFTGIKVEDGWKPAVVFREKGIKRPLIRVKPFLINADGTICENIFLHIRLRDNSVESALDAVLLMHMLDIMLQNGEMDFRFILNPDSIFGLDIISKAKKSEILALLRRCPLRVEPGSNNTIFVRYASLEEPAAPLHNGSNEQIYTFYENIVEIPAGGVLGNPCVSHNKIASFDFGCLMADGFEPSRDSWRWSEI